jgi:hypothetical protein
MKRDMTQDQMTEMLQGCGVLPPMYEEGEAPPTARARKPARDGRAKGEGGDRFAVLNGFVDFTMAVLTRNEIAVWLVLYRDTREGQARVSQEDIARRAGASRRTVTRVIKKLRRQGLLRVPHQGGFNRGASAYKVEPFGREGV